MEEQKDTGNCYYFTFGHGQIPGIGYYCKIYAKSFDEAREVMFKRTRKFCGQYDSPEAAGVDRFNLEECYWDEYNRGWSTHPV